VKTSSGSLKYKYFGVLNVDALDDAGADLHYADFRKPEEREKYRLPEKYKDKAANIFQTRTTFAVRLTKWPKWPQIGAVEAIVRFKHGDC